MMLFSSKEKRKRALVVFLILLGISLITFSVTYGIKYFSKPNSPDTIIEPVIPDSPPIPPHLLPILKELENKIFNRPDPFKFSEEELEVLKLLLSYEINNPILENNEKFRVIRKLSDDLKRASDAYKNIKKDLVYLDLTTLSPEVIKSFENLSACKVSCFQGIRDDLKRISILKPKVDDIPVNQTDTYPIIDYRLDDSVETELYQSFPNFSVYREILLKPSFNLKAIMQTIPLIEKLCLQKFRQNDLNPRAFEMDLLEKFFSLASYKLKYTPCDLLNIFKANQNFSMLLTFTCIREASFKPAEVASILDQRFLRYLRIDSMPRDDWTCHALLFLKQLLDWYFLLDLPSSVRDPIALKNEETYRSLFDLIQQIYSKSSLIQNEDKYNFNRYDLPTFMEYWKSSICNENVRAMLSCKTESNFDFLKGRFFSSRTSNNRFRNVNLIPIIYWSMNFRLSRNFDIKFLASRSDPREVILIMICSHVTLSLFDKEFLISILYDGAPCYKSPLLVEILAFIQFALYDSIPLELFRREDLTEWNEWNSHFNIVVKRLQKFNKPFFSDFSGQVNFLQQREMAIQDIRLSFKNRFEQLLSGDEFSGKLGATLFSLFVLLKELRVKCAKSKADYAKGLKLHVDGKPEWLIDLTNNLIGFISASFNNPKIDISFEDHFHSTSCEDMQILYDSLNKSKMEAKYVLFENLNYFTEMENKRLFPEEINSSTSVELNLDEKTFKRVSPFHKSFSNWNFDLECTRLSINSLSSLFGFVRKDFIDTLKPYFSKNPTSAEVLNDGNRFSDINLALKYAQYEILYHLKHDFWFTNGEFLAIIQEIFQAHNYSKLLEAWNSLVTECKDLLERQHKLAEEYPKLKINVFSGLQLTAKFISSENELLVLKAFNSLFRLLERLVDSQGDLSVNKEILEKILLFPLLFCQSTDEEQTRDIPILQDCKMYSNLLYVLRGDFHNYFNSETRHKYVTTFPKLFEKVKSYISESYLPLDPAQAMILGRKETVDNMSFIIDVFCEFIFEHLKPFRNPKEQDRKFLLNLTELIHIKLLELVRGIVPKFTEIPIDFNFRYNNAVARNPFKTHPMEPALQRLFRDLDQTYNCGLKLEPIAEKFVDIELRRRIPDA
jgi:hypothetical protein